MREPVPHTHMHTHTYLFHVCLRMYIQFAIPWPPPAAWRGGGRRAEAEPERGPPLALLLPRVPRGSLGTFTWCPLWPSCGSGSLFFVSFGEKRKVGERTFRATAYRCTLLQEKGKGQYLHCFILPVLYFCSYILVSIDIQFHYSYKWNFPNACEYME